MSKSVFKIVISLCSLLVEINASAQYAGASYSQGPAGFEILQVDTRGYSTLVYMAYTTPDSVDAENTVNGISFSNKTHIEIGGNAKKYRMFKAINMPVSGEAESKWAVFDKVSQRHQFVLEFEKIPSCQSFNLIEDADNPDASNFYGVTYNPVDSASFVDINDYIVEYPVKECGQFMADGNVAYYAECNGIVVTVTPFVVKQYGKYYNMSICVQNNSDRSVLFDPNRISVEGCKFKVDKKKNLRREENVNLQLLQYADYDKIVKNKQRWNAFAVAFCEGLAAGTAGYSSSTTTYTGTAYSSYGTAYTTYGQSTTQSYDAGAAYMASQRAAANSANYANGQQRRRQQLGAGYVRLQTIPADAEYSGYFNVKYKKADRITLRITIDGETYPFVIF